MELVFALIMLTLLVVAWRSYRKGNTEWLRQERYEESGAWLDKRSGERGTYGSLDEEMEQERQLMRRKAASTELADLLHLHLFRTYPAAFAELRDDHLRHAKTTMNAWANSVVLLAEQLLRESQLPSCPTDIKPANADALALKKKVLDFLFHFYPKLVEVEIEQVKNLDEWIQAAAQDLLSQLEGEKILFSGKPPSAPANKI